MSVPMQYGVVMMMTAVSPRMRLLLSCAERTKSLPAHCGTSATPIATASAAATMKLSRKKKQWCMGPEQSVLVVTFENRKSQRRSYNDTVMRVSIVQVL